MKLSIFTIGKLKSKAVQAIVGDYSGRLKHYVKFELMSFRDEGSALAKVSGGDYLAALDERGSGMSSKDIAEFFDKHRTKGTKRVVFLVGGENGLGEAARKRADWTLSLSKMTFPHEFVTAILLEQIYRAFTIIKGEPYHRG